MNTLRRNIMDTDQSQLSTAKSFRSESKNQQRCQQQPQPRRVSSLFSPSIDAQAATPFVCPRRVSNVDQEDTSICSSTPSKKVSFAAQSQLHIYPVDAVERFKAYTSKERRAFQAEAFYDALRIQELIESSPHKGGAAIRYLIDKNLLKTEELLGIENYIVGAEKVMKDRRSYAKFVVATHKQLEMKEKKEVNVATKLAKAAIAKSSKNFEKARLRAALAV